MRILRTMFYSLLSFCPRKELYRASIYSCFNEYKNCYYTVTKQDKNCKPFMDIKEWEQLSPETHKIYHENAKKQKEIVEEMVALVKVYCKKYPDEKICHHCNFKTYDEYPYRLPQTIQDFIKLL